MGIFVAVALRIGQHARTAKTVVEGGMDVPVHPERRPKKTDCIHWIGVCPSAMV